METICIQFEDQHIHCRKGENLREVLMRHDLIDYDRFGNWGLCKGSSDCGTCSLRVSGELSLYKENPVRRVVSNEKVLTCCAWVEGDLVVHR